MFKFNTLLLSGKTIRLNSKRNLASNLYPITILYLYKFFSVSYSKFLYLLPTSNCPDQFLYIPDVNSSGNSIKYTPHTEIFDF